LDLGRDACVPALIHIDWLDAMVTIRNLIRCDSGASAAEYALILAIVSASIAIAAGTLSQTIANSMNNMTGKIATCGGTC
jgi:pilus assembly protein Flp/PilA